MTPLAADSMRSIMFRATAARVGWQGLRLETELLPTLCQAGELGGQVFDGAFVDIGVPASLAEAEHVLASA